MTEPKMPRNWPQMDPGEQWESALKLATAEVEKDRDKWEEETRKEQLSKAKMEWNAVHHRWLNVWGIIGGTVLVALCVWAVIGIGGCTAQGTSEARAKAAELASWTDRCLTSGGSIYRDAENSVGVRLCVVGGKVTTSHE